jgi:hypothetical protein
VTKTHRLRVTRGPEVPYSDRRVDAVSAKALLQSNSINANSSTNQAPRQQFQLREYIPPRLWPVINHNEFDELHAHCSEIVQVVSCFAA